MGTVIANNTIVGNSAWESYGWSYGRGESTSNISPSSPTIRSPAIAPAMAAGIYIYGGSQPAAAPIANNIVAGNSSGIFVSPNALPSLSYNCVYGNGACNYVGIADPTGSSGNLSVDPAFCQPALWPGAHQCRLALHRHRATMP